MKLQEFAANKITRLNQAIDMLRDYIEEVNKNWYGGEGIDSDYLQEINDVIDFLQQMKEIML